MTALEVGMPARITGLPGVYKVTAIHPTYVELYGGDKDPMGKRQFRCVDPSRVRPRKLTATEQRASA